jgi:amidophosphoribosyltransferase
MALCENGYLKDYTHHGLLRQHFSKEVLSTMKGKHGIGSVSSEREPIVELSKNGCIIIAFDGNISNHKEMKDALLAKGTNFSGYHNSEEVVDSVLISSIIAKEASFEEGVRKLASMMKGDFAVVALAKEGIYAARGWGRKPLVLGKRGEDYAVASESNAFENLGFEIVRDVAPGEIVFLNENGIKTLAKLNLLPVKYGTFEWIYTAYPASIIDGKSVAEARMNIGRLLAKRYPVDADIVSPVPNSGRWHAIGYSKESKIPYKEAFVRYDYSDRSYTPSEQADRDKEAKIKLIPVRSVIKGKRVVIVDDSIVRGTQLLNRVLELRRLGAKEVHARIACPPLMAACLFGKSTRSDSECIARRMSIEEIRKKLELDSLGYATIEDLEEAIGVPRDKLCTHCWGVK